MIESLQQIAGLAPAIG